MNWRTRLAKASGGEQRPLAEIEDSLFFDAGERLRKHSTFWSLLVLSTIIAAGGVVTNSTATVVGAMVIAPLGTPIFGTALGIVVGSRRRVLYAGSVLLAGIVVAIVLGGLIGAIAPQRFDDAVNPQVTARASPAMLDLLVAVATGAAGAFALTRRDVASILPGVAIAISLVPPLAVVGITAGRAEWPLCLGALTLYFANVSAMLLTGVTVFAAFGYRKETPQPSRRVSTLGLAAIGLSIAALLVPLGLESRSVQRSDVWVTAIHTAVNHWTRGSTWRLESVDASARTIVITLSGSGPSPPLDGLRNEIRQNVPPSIAVRLVERPAIEVPL